ncbi:hypothetical protein LCGC14_2381590, partial [marine sediment metagenome]
MTIISPTRKSQIASLLKDEKATVSSSSVSGSWLKSALDEMLEKEQPLWNPPQRYFRGSDAGNPCPRSMTMKALGHNVPVPARVKRIFETGNAIEAVNVKAARRAKLLVEGSQQRDASYGGTLRIIR